MKYMIEIGRHEIKDTEENKITEKEKLSLWQYSNPSLLWWR